MLIPTKILVPTDFSKHSDNAIVQAFDIAQEYKSKVFLLHVVQERLSHSLEDYGLTPESIRKMETKMTNTAKKRLKKQIEKLKPSEGLEVLGEVVIGIPSEEILKFQQEQGIDLIIISSLGNTGLAKYFIGGVARNVLKGSTCTVLLTK